MTDRLFTPPPADENTLTDRQRFVLRELRANPAGLSSEQVGRAVHDEFVPSHSASCPWCSQAGSSLLKHLKGLGLVALRRGGIWQVRDGAIGAPASPDGYDPETSVIPF